MNNIRDSNKMRKSNKNERSFVNRVIKIEWKQARKLIEIEGVN